MIFRRGEPHEDAILLACQEAAFGRQLGLDWWRRWSYGCPTGPAHNYAAWLGNRPVGLVSAQRQPIWLEGRKVDAWLLANLCVLPEHRRQGLFTRLMEYVLERCSPALVVPNRNSEVPLRLMGASELGRLQFATLRPPFRAAALPAVGQLPPWRPHYAFQVDWTPERQRWRYLERPGQRYRLFAIGPEYLVTKQFEDRCHVLDWSSSLMARYAEAEARRQAASLLNMWCLVGRHDSPWDLDPTWDPRYLLGFGLRRLPEGEAWFCLGDNDVF